VHESYARGSGSRALSWPITNLQTISKKHFCH
jgi:hypothetical protein